jgi:DNA-binding NarL/FixJ family response regulator
VETNPSTSATACPSTIGTVVIEGDLTMSGILGSWLQDAGGFSCVGQFHDVEKACAEVIARKPNVVLVDINLPNLHGVECIRKLKPSLPDTQFIALTTYEDSDRIFDALLAGATGYLLKRTPRAMLVSTLREVHAGGSPMTSNIARKVVQLLHKSRHSRNPEDQLSKQENEVLALLARGYLCEEIADQLHISTSTVGRRIRRVYEELRAPARPSAWSHRPTAST